MVKMIMIPTHDAAGSSSCTCVRAMPLPIDICTAVADGCSSMRDLRDELNIATQCGRCAMHAICWKSTLLGEIQEPMVAAA